MSDTQPTLIPWGIIEAMHLDSQIFPLQHIPRQQSYDNNLVLILDVGNDNKIEYNIMGGPITSESIVMIHCHGNEETLRQNLTKMKFLSEQLKCVMVSWEYKGYNPTLNPGVLPTEYNTTTDFYEFVTALQRKFSIDAERLILYGRSLGTAIVGEVCSRIQPFGVILESPLSSGRLQYLRQRRVSPTQISIMETLTPQQFDVFRTIRFVGKCSSKFVLVHGSLDNVIPVQSVYDIRKAIENSNNGTVEAFNVFKDSHHDDLMVKHEKEILHMYSNLVNTARRHSKLIQQIDPVVLKQQSQMGKTILHDYFNN